MLAPTIAHLSFVRDDGQPLDFIPGQFLQVHFHYADGTATKRSYSLATLHDHAQAPGDAVEIAVSYVAGGAATALFEGLDIGDRIDDTQFVSQSELGSERASRVTAATRIPASRAAWAA